MILVNILWPLNIGNTKVNRPPLLLSYYFYRTRDLLGDLKQIYGDNLPEIFLDSGAYSAFTSGSEIDIDDYMAYIHQYKDIITNYANLDVIGDWKSGHENQRIMETSGLSPLPVYHQSDPWELLEPMAERYDYIALGGMVGKPRNLLRRYLLRSFSLFKRLGYPCKVHGFGITKWEFVRAFPWTSVDSSTWTQGFRYGTLRIFHNGKFMPLAMADMKSVYDKVDQMLLYGVTPNELVVPGRYKRQVMAKMGAYAWMRAEDWINEHRGYSVDYSGIGGRNGNLILPPIFSTPSHVREIEEHEGTSGLPITIFLASWLFDKAQEDGLRSIQINPPEKKEREYNGKYDRPGYDRNTDPGRTSISPAGRSKGRGGQPTGTRRAGDQGVDKEGGICDPAHNKLKHDADSGGSRKKDRSARATERRIQSSERSSSSVGGELHRLRGERAAASLKQNSGLS